MTEKKQTDKILTKKDFLGLPEPEVHKVWIDSMQGYVYMKEPTGGEQDAYEGSLLDFIDNDDGTVKPERKMDAMKAKYLVFVLCSDAKGRRLFVPNEYEYLAQKKREVLRELHDKAIEVIRTTQDTEEEMRKNSNTGKAEDLPFG